MLISIFADNAEGNKRRLWKFAKQPRKSPPKQSFDPIPQKPCAMEPRLGRAPDS
jgi:hypothetical protein